MIDELKIPAFLQGQRPYAIPHLTLWAESVSGPSRPMFRTDNGSVTVEEVARRLFLYNGFEVFHGTDAHFFLSLMASNFHDSFLVQVLQNYLGNSAQELLTPLEPLATASLAQGAFVPGHLEAAARVLHRYYLNYEPKQRLYQQLFPSLQLLDGPSLYRLFVFHRALGYRTKGIPDLFLTCGSWFGWVEVKSIGDTLRVEQYDFIERYLATVGPTIYVLRILPKPMQPSLTPPSRPRGVKPTHPHSEFPDIPLSLPFMTEGAEEGCGGQPDSEFPDIPLSPPFMTEGAEEGCGGQPAEGVDTARLVIACSPGELDSTAIDNVVELNHQGIAHEKCGDIESAILCYEKNIKLRYPGTHAYERLMMLYHRQGNITEEIKVINIAIEVFNKELERRTNLNVYTTNIEETINKYKNRLERCLKKKKASNT
jgi:tetratricopeptide (TPR) repeat protein